MRFLIIESESREERDARRAVLGASSGESFAATLADMTACTTTFVRPGEGDDTVAAGDLAAFDAVFLSGSPIHVYDGSEAVRRLVDFMRLVFVSGTPSFGSCAGLHIAVAAAGGSVRPMGGRMEAGIARRITATADGRGHPMLAGRSPVWDAPSVHGDEVESLPAGATVLATNAVTAIQAAAIAHDRGTFWGVQYHPELSPGEIAAALRRQAADLVKAGIAGSEDVVADRATQLDRLEWSPDRTETRWLLGIDDEFAVQARRRREIGNFLEAVPETRR